MIKSIKYKGRTYVGDPLNAIKIFNEKEVDEIIVLDIDATKEIGNPNYDLIYSLAGECFMPLTYGGGISNLNQASQLFSLGVEKIALEHSTIHNPNLILNLIDKYGSQAITASVSVKRNFLSKKCIYDHSIQKVLNINFSMYIENLINLGVGEIFLTSVDRDGTLNGLDKSLLSELRGKVPVPLIINGGVGSPSDILEGFSLGADAVGVGSYFVFNGPHKAVLISYLTHEERSFISENLRLNE
jgi:cyclase